MDPTGYAVGGLGVALGLARAIEVFRRNIAADPFATIIFRLLETGNRERALRLCKAAPQATFVRIVEATIEAEPGDARDDALRSEIAATYDRAATAQLGALGRRAWQASAAMALAAAAIVLAFTASPPDTGPLAPAGFAAVLGLFSWTTRRKTIERTAAQRDAVIDSVVDSINRDRGEQRKNANLDQRLGGESSGPRQPESAPRLVEPAPAPASPRRRRSSSEPDVGSDEHEASSQDDEPPSTAPALVADMRRGTCPLCGSHDIGDGPRSDDGALRARLCRGCGYVQWFAADHPPG